MLPWSSSTCSTCTYTYICTFTILSVACMNNQVISVREVTNVIPSQIHKSKKKWTINVLINFILTAKCYVKFHEKTKIMEHQDLQEAYVIRVFSSNLMIS